MPCSGYLAMQLPASGSVSELSDFDFSIGEAKKQRKLPDSPNLFCSVIGVHSRVI